MTFIPNNIFNDDTICEKHNFKGTPCVSCLLEKKQEWTSANIDTPFDGEYLCVIEILQECGNTWIRQRVRENSNNKWLLEPGEVITHYQKLPPNPNN